MHSSYRAQVRKAIVQSGVGSERLMFEERTPGQSTPTGIRNHNGALVVRFTDEPTLHFTILHSGNEWLCTFANPDLTTQSRRRIYVADGAFPDLVILLQDWIGRAAHAGSPPVEPLAVAH
jgi:hypothetical protein